MICCAGIVEFVSRMAMLVGSNRGSSTAAAAWSSGALTKTRDIQAAGLSPGRRYR